MTVAATLLVLGMAPAAMAEVLISQACIDQNKAGIASCKAVCPQNGKALNCGASFGALTTGDTCEALARTFSAPTGANGQPSQFPHDRCSFYAICADRGQLLSVQGWATCYQD